MLLERDRELELLDRLVQSILAGDAVLALLEGPAGIGKSSVLAKAREKAAAAGFRVVAARGSDLERELPYGIVRQLFESLLLDLDCRERWLTGSARAAARVFAPPDEDEPAGGGWFGVLHGLFWLTANVAADGPLCLSIDDLQWCDRASLRFIAYLERRLDGLGVLVVTAARVDDSDAESRMILDIVQDPAAVAMRLSALSEDGVVQIVRDRLGPDAERPFCAAQRTMRTGRLGRLVDRHHQREQECRQAAGQRRARPSRPYLEGYRAAALRKRWVGRRQHANHEGPRRHVEAPPRERDVPRGGVAATQLPRQRERGGRAGRALSQLSRTRRPSAGPVWLLFRVR